MQQQFPSEEPLRAQRMTADETHSVIALWQQEQTEQTGLTDRPAVPDVAEGLNISVEDVQRLLAGVRAQRFEEENALAQERELTEIRLAEEGRKLAEVRRQRAELRREQQASVRPEMPRAPIHFVPRSAPMQLPQNDFVLDFLQGFLPGFLGITFSLLLIMLLLCFRH